VAHPLLAGLDAYLCLARRHVVAVLQQVRGEGVPAIPAPE